MTRRFGEELRREGVLKLYLDFFLVVGRDLAGRTPSVRVTAGYPSLSRNERAINLKMELPVALFEAPVLQASISVAAPNQPISIDAKAIAEAVHTAIGMDVHIAVKGGDE